MRRSMRLGLVCVLLLLATSLRAQDKDSLGTKITANGDSIALAWDPKHPWDAQIAAGGAVLMAEYETRTQGVVAEKLAQAKPFGAQSKVLTFSLPEHLVAEPVGRVCLYIQVAGHMLPVRRPTAQQGETSRFRDSGWEQAAAKRSSAYSQEQLATGLQARLEAAERNANSLRAELAAKKLDSPKACQGIKMESFALAEKGPDILPVSEHDAAARRVCSSRVAWTRAADEQNLKEAKTPADLVEVRMISAQYVQVPAVLAQVFALLDANGGAKDSNEVSRKRQFAEFAEDYRRWQPTAAAYTAPAFGKATDHLTIQTLAMKQAEVVLAYLAPGVKGPRPSYAELSGFVGSSLETYSRCVVDGRTQLMTKLTAWNEMQAQAVGQDQRGLKQLREGCERRFEALARAEEQVAKLKQEVQQHPPANAAGGTAVDVYARPVVLNAVACSLK